MNQLRLFLTHTSMSGVSASPTPYGSQSPSTTTLSTARKSSFTCSSFSESSLEGWESSSGSSSGQCRTSRSTSSPGPSSSVSLLSSCWFWFTLEVRIEDVRKRSSLPRPTGNRRKWWEARSDLCRFWFFTLLLSINYETFPKARKNILL